MNHKKKSSSNNSNHHNSNNHFLSNSNRSLSIASKLVFFNGLFVMVYGFISLIFTSIVVEEHFSNIGVLFAGFALENPGAVGVAFALSRISGIAGISLGIMVMYFASTCFRERKKTSWWVWLIAGGVGWGGLLFIESMIRTPVTKIIALIGLLIYLASVIIPAKAIFSE